MSNLAWTNRYQGGLCYALCQETFNWYNNSVYYCKKGCDFSVGRANDPKGREESEQMCKRYTAESMYTKRGELDNIQDLRVNGDMYPTKPENLYKACLAGVRRQKY